MIVGLGYTYVHKEKTIPVKPSTNTQTAYCPPNSLISTIQFDGAAGSIYGNLTIKNISSVSCQIEGSNFVDITYQVNNISVNHQGEVGPSIITLEPNQTIYSQVRYQNGPQCSSPIKQTPVKFTYTISPNSFVTFENENEQTTQEITTCTNSTEMTQVTTWGLSTQPIQ